MIRRGVANTPNRRCGPVESLACAVVLAALVAAPGPCAAQTAVLTVGPHGTYPTIQAAVNNAVDGWVNDVRIESGSYYEHVVISGATLTMNSGELNLSGGWDATFTSQVPIYALTQVYGSGTGRCFLIQLTTPGVTKIRLSNMYIAYGLATYGAGIAFQTFGNVRLEVDGVRFFSNIVEHGDATPTGGGLWAWMEGNGNQLVVSRCVFDGNIARGNPSTSAAFGGGAYLYVSGASPVQIDRCDFLHNQVADADLLLGAGMYLVQGGGGSLGSITDTRIMSNSAQTSASPSVRGVGLMSAITGSDLLIIRRAHLSSNQSLTGDGEQLRIVASGSSFVRAGEIILGKGHTGAEVEVTDEAEVRFTNLTVADNTDVGFDLTVVPPAFATLHNSIFFGNGIDLNASGPVSGGHLLDGVDPLFVNPAAGDYRLGPGSPAENAGTYLTAAGLGDADVDGGVRVIDGTVDIGAYEGIGVLFSDAFAHRDTARWSSTLGQAD